MSALVKRESRVDGVICCDRPSLDAVVFPLAARCLVHIREIRDFPAGGADVRSRLQGARLGAAVCAAGAYSRWRACVHGQR